MSILYVSGAKSNGVFTGLIEEVGRVLWIRMSDRGTQLQLTAPKLAPQTAVGDSVAVNGCCLTVSSRRDEHSMTLTDHNGDLRPDGADGFNEIRCPVCGSPAFMYPRVLDDDKPVICAGCRAFVSTYGEMKRRSEG